MTLKKYCTLFLIVGCAQAFADDHYLPPAQGQTCSRDEIENAVRRARGETLDIVRQDMQVESRVTITSYGVNERECFENGARRIRENGAGDEAVRDCNDKRRLYKDVSCAIVDTHVVGGASTLVPTSRTAETNSWYPEDQDQCVQNSMAQAEQNAMKDCQAGGLPCEITERASKPNMADHTLYIKDDWRGPHRHQSVYCKSHATAAPTRGGAQVQCSVEGVARMKL